MLETNAKQSTIFIYIYIHIMSDPVINRISSFFDNNQGVDAQINMSTSK